MEWIVDNWPMVSALAVSVLANAVVAAKLKSAKKFAITVIEVYADKVVSDKEKIAIYDDFMAMAKDMLAVVKGLTPWK